jgi:hypothetical protein
MGPIFVSTNSPPGCPATLFEGRIPRPSPSLNSIVNSIVRTSSVQENGFRHAVPAAPWTGGNGTVVFPSKDSKLPMNSYDEKGFEGTGPRALMNRVVGRTTPMRERSGKGKTMSKLVQRSPGCKQDTANTIRLEARPKHDASFFPLEAGPQISGDKQPFCIDSISKGAVQHTPRGDQNQGSTEIWA